MEDVILSRQMQLTYMVRTFFDLAAESRSRRQEIHALDAEYVEKCEAGTLDAEFEARYKATDRRVRSPLVFLIEKYDDDDEAGDGNDDPSSSKRQTRIYILTSDRANTIRILRSVLPGGDFRNFVFCTNFEETMDWLNEAISLGASFEFSPSHVAPSA